MGTKFYSIFFFSLLFFSATAAVSLSNGGMAYADPLDLVDCPGDQIFDEVLEVCTFAPAVCPGDAEFNPATGQCEVAPTCPSGGTFNTSTNQCETDPICDVGNYSNSRSLCAELVSCPEGYVIDTLLGRCIDNSGFTCPTGYTFSFDRLQCQGPAPSCPAGFFFDSRRRQCTSEAFCPPESTLRIDFVKEFDYCVISGEVTSDTICLDGFSPTQRGTRYFCTQVPNCPEGSTYNRFTENCMTIQRPSCPPGEIYRSSELSCFANVDCGSGFFNLLEIRCEAFFSCPSGMSQNIFVCEKNSSCSAGTLNTSTDFCEADSSCVGTLNESSNLCEDSSCGSDGIYVPEELQCHFVDTEPPTISTTSYVLPLEFIIPATLDPLNLNRGSTDNVGIKSFTVSPNTFDCDDLTLGESLTFLPVTLTATDYSDNQAVFVATMGLIDNVGPLTMLMDLLVFLDASGNVQVLTSDFDDGTTDNCGVGKFLALEVNGVTPPDLQKIDFTTDDIGDNQVLVSPLDIFGHFGAPTLATVTVDQDDDGDGIGNLVDNCPDDVNPEQEDRDNDGVGDACDNTPPVADDGSISTDEDTPVNEQAVATDVDEDSLTYMLVGGPTNGDLVFNDDGSYTYTPDPDYNGPDLFTFKASDFEFDSNVARINIDVISVNDAPVCEDATVDTDSLWPPTHKFKTVTASMGATDVDGDELTISIVSVFQDEPVNGTGDGDKSPDAEITGDTTADIRAERSGNENGRVYHITVEASDGELSCTGTITVGVPHDKKDTAVDDGSLYDSTTS